MSVIAVAKSKLSRGNVKEAFKNEAGAIDLASIMVGIIVIGLIGGVIAATVFAVIPWAQNNAAKQQLDSIVAAQSAYMGLSADFGQAQFGGAPISVTTSGSTTTYAFTNGPAGRTIGGEAGGVDTPVKEKLFSAPADSKLAVGWWGSGTGAHYAAAVKSSSGTVFYVTDSKTQPTNNTDVAATTHAKAVVDSVKNL